MSTSRNVNNIRLVLWIMASRYFLFIISVIVGASTATGTFLPNPGLWASGIQCTINPCIGTNGPEGIKADAKSNQINGKAGDDSIWSFAGNDEICGGSGNDYIEGGDGNDIILPDMSTKNFCDQNVQYGADTVLGGDGDDVIFSGSQIYTTASDGHKDTIDCGPGLDTAYINKYADQDVIVNCENVNKGTR